MAGGARGAGGGASGGGIWVKMKLWALVWLLSVGGAEANPAKQLVQCLGEVERAFMQIPGAGPEGFARRWKALERLSADEARCIATLSTTCIAGDAPEACLPSLGQLLSSGVALEQMGLPRKLPSPPASASLAEDFADFRKTLLAPPLARPCDVPPHLAKAACPVLGQGQRLLLLRHWQRVVRALKALG